MVKVYLLIFLLHFGNVELRNFGVPGGWRGRRSSSRSSSSPSSSSSWGSRSYAKSPYESSSSSWGSRSYAKSPYESSESSWGRRSYAKSPYGTPGGGGSYRSSPSSSGASTRDSGVRKQYSEWSKPRAALGTHTASNGVDKFGYKTPGYGTSWGTNFAGGTGKFVMKKGFSKKALGLGVAAGFLGSSALSAAGARATYSVYHRYQAFRQMMVTRNPGMYGDWDDSYYSNYYQRNECFSDCPTHSHCEWGFCECTDRQTYVRRRHGRCYAEWNLPSLSARPSSFDPFIECTESSTCTTVDMNLICNWNMENLNIGKCECKKDMQWNKELGECQIYMDVDCSSITYDTTPSELILEAVEKAKKNINEDLLGNVVPLGRTESANESLANSLLTRMDSKNATDAEITEAFCRDIDSFSFELQPPIPDPPKDLRPNLSCSVVPKSACALAYNTHDCTGEWKLVIPKGELRFKYFSSNWKYRNSIDTIGVRAGCRLTLFDDSSFSGHSLDFEAEQPSDRWVVLGESKFTSYQQMKNNVESLQCICWK